MICYVSVDEMQLDHISEFNYLESNTDGTEYFRKVANERKVYCAIISLLKDITLQLERSKVLQEGLPVAFFMYESEKMRWTERIVKVNNIISLSCKGRIDIECRIDGL